MHGSMAGRAFGEELHLSQVPGARRVDPLVAARSTIARIELVRNGKTIHAVNPNDWNTHFIYEDEEDLSAAWLSSRHLNKFIYYYARGSSE